MNKKRKKNLLEEDIKESLSDIISDFELIVKMLHEMSYKFENVTAPIRKAISTHFLAHIGDSCVSILKLLPYNELSATNDKEFAIFFNLSLFRNVIEATNNLYYYSLEEITEEESNFRLLLFYYHNELETLNMAELLSFETTIKEIDVKQIEEKKYEILKDPIYLSLDKNLKKLIIDGKRYSHLTQTEIAKRRGIDFKYFRGLYKLLSGYTHSLPFAMDSIAVSTVHNFSINFYASILNIVIYFLNSCLADILLRMGKFWDLHLSKSDESEIVYEYASALTEEFK